MDFGVTIPTDDIRVQESRPSREAAPQTKKPESGQLVGLNSGLICKHALAVFVSRPQADYQIGALRKNNQESFRRQTGGVQVPAKHGRPTEREPIDAEHSLQWLEADLSTVPGARISPSPWSPCDDTRHRCLELLLQPRHSIARTENEADRSGARLSFTSFNRSRGWP
jgi:hypothetical protein